MDGDLKTVEATPDPTHYPALARRLVFNQIAARIAQTDLHIKFTEDQVYVVWFSYCLGNWKAVCTSTLPDGRYYEVTFSAAKHEAYVDTYIKLDNHVVHMDN